MCAIVRIFVRALIFCFEDGVPSEPPGAGIRASAAIHPVRAGVPCSRALCLCQRLTNLVEARGLRPPLKQGAAPFRLGCEGWSLRARFMLVCAVPVHPEVYVCVSECVCVYVCMCVCVCVSEVSTSCTWL